MSKYVKREFIVGRWWLELRGNAYYGIRYLPEKQRNERRSLHTSDLEVAKVRLVELHRDSVIPKEEKPTEVFLADVLVRYYNDYAKHLVSEDATRRALLMWLEHWNDARVSDLRDVTKQEVFHEYLRSRGLKPSSMMRIINVGKAALNRARQRNELDNMPSVLTVKVGKPAPKGRPLDIEEMQAIYLHAVPHVRAFMEWGLGTAARPQAIFELHSSKIDFIDGRVDLLPAHRVQIPKKHRPVVRLPEALRTPFEGFAVAYEGECVASIKGALWRACDRANVERCSSYSFRHTAARWMRRQGVPPWEVAAQLGHSGGSQYSVTERYAAYDPTYLSKAVVALSELVMLVRSSLATKAAVIQSGLAEADAAVPRQQLSVPLADGRELQPVPHLQYAPVFPSGGSRQAR